MKTTIAGWLRRLAEWLDPTIVAEVPADPALAVARVLVHVAESLPHTGAYKRAKVMIALMAQFPQRRRRELSMCIEQALLEQR